MGRPGPATVPVAGDLAVSRRLLAEATPDSPLTMFSEGVISFAHGDGLRPPPAIVSRAAWDAACVRGNRSVAIYQFRLPHDKLDEALLERQLPWYGTSYPSVVFGPGVTGLFHATVVALDLWGADLIVPRGFYHAWVAWAERHSMTIRAVDIAVNGFSLEQLEAALAASVKPVVLIANPSYIGQVFPDTLLHDTAKILVKHGAFLIEDCIFARDVHCGLPYKTICSYLPANYRACIVDSASKSFGLANARAGWIIGPTAVTGPVRDTLDTIGPSYSYISQEMLLAALRIAPGYLEENLAELDWRRTTVHDALGMANHACGRALLTAPFGDGGSHSICLRWDLADVETETSLARFLLNDYAIACPPGFSHGLEATDIRLNYGCVGQHLVGVGLGEGAQPLPHDGSMAHPDFAEGRRLLQRGLERLQEAAFQVDRHGLATR